MPEDPQPQPPPFNLGTPHQFRKTHSISGRADSRIVKELIDSMIKNGWIGLPIDVAEYAGEYYILNGHHRTFAARLAKIMVRYRIVPPEEIITFGYDSLDQVVEAHAQASPNRIRLR